MIKIKKWFPPNGQRFYDGKKAYVVSSLHAQSKDLEVKEMPLEHLNFYKLYPEIASMKDFVMHIDAVLNADMDKPIILDTDGYVMDGTHRIAKALLEQRETIKFVRFYEEPVYDYEDENNAGNSS